jgi:drug/metabolite transporter, DME family
MIQRARDTMNEVTSQAAASAGDAAGRDPLYGRGVVMIMVAGCFFSLGGILIRLVEDAGPWQILMVRSIMLSAAIIAVLVARHRGRVVAEFRKCGIAAVIGALCLGVAFSGFVFSLMHTTVANTVFILCASPFVTAPLAWLVLGERVRRATWASMVFAIIGVAIMVGGGINSGALLGNLIALCAVVGFAGFAVALRWGRDTDMLALTCLAGLFTAIVAAVMSDSFAMSAYDLGLCAIMGLVQMGAGMVLFTKGSRYVPAAELALLSLTEVVLAPIWVWLWLAEVPRLWTLVGGAVVLLAIIGHAITGMRRKPPPFGAV